MKTNWLTVTKNATKTVTPFVNIDSATHLSIDKIETEISTISQEYDESLMSCVKEMSKCRYDSSTFKDFLQFSDMPDDFLPLSHQLTAKEVNSLYFSATGILPQSLSDHSTSTGENHDLDKSVKSMLASMKAGCNASDYSDNLDKSVKSMLASMKAGCSASDYSVYSDPLYDDSVYSDPLSPGSPDDEDSNIVVYSESLSTGQISQLEEYDPVVVLSRVSPAMDIYS